MGLLEPLGGEEAQPQEQGHRGRVAGIVVEPPGGIEVGLLDHVGGVDAAPEPMIRRRVIMRRRRLRCRSSRSPQAARSPWRARRSWRSPSSGRVAGEVAIRDRLHTPGHSGQKKTGKFSARRSCHKVASLRSPQYRARKNPARRPRAARLAELRHTEAIALGCRVFRVSSPCWIAFGWLSISSLGEVQDDAGFACSASCGSGFRCLLSRSSGVLGSVGRGFAAVRLVLQASRWTGWTE